MNIPHLIVAHLKSLNKSLKPVTGKRFTSILRPGSDNTHHNKQRYTLIFPVIHSEQNGLNYNFTKPLLPYFSIDPKVIGIP